MSMFHWLGSGCIAIVVPKAALNGEGAEAMRPSLIELLSFNNHQHL
jgi:hypothetical protein